MQVDYAKWRLALKEAPTLQCQLSNGALLKQLIYSTNRRTRDTMFFFGASPGCLEQVD